MRSNWWRAFVLMIVVVAVVLLANTDADAQCSMCRAALTSARDSRFIRNFNIGVLVLLVPPAAIFCSIFIALKRYKAADERGSTQINKES